MRVISLGAGVQSTTMYLMSCDGELPVADVAIFADTGWEPKAVYEHVERLKSWGKIPIVTVSKGNLRDDALNKTGFASMPLFTRDMFGKISMLRRQCTREYKVQEVLREIKKRGATAKEPAKVWIGISVDEAHRMKGSFVKYTVHEWPLIELGMNRNDCRQYLKQRGWDVPKSSCIGCPFHDDHYWLRLKRESPNEWADAVAFDQAIRHLPRLQDETFLHRTATPLDRVELGENQLELWGNECYGVCGV